jgi:creatinine amidohydrolase
MKNAEVLYEVKGPKNMQEMTAYELADLLKETDLFLMSCGATENHSFHLPIGSDNYQGEYLVKRTAEKLADLGIKSVPGFTVPFGVETNSFERQSLFGNASLKPSTFIAVLKDLIKSLHEDGFNKFVMILNHAENWAPMQVAAQELYEEYGIKCLAVNWIPPMNDFWPTVLKNTKHQGHGGEDETACVLATVPKLVHHEHAKPYYHDDHPEADVDFGGLFYDGGAAGIYAPLSPDNSPGYIGDPASATAEAGEACHNAYAEWIAKVVRKYFYPELI